MVVAYLFRLQRQLLLKFNQDMAEYQTRLSEYKAAVAKAKEDGVEPPSQLEKPVFRRVILADTTIEKLAEVLEDNPKGLMVARDELAGWFGSMSRLQGQGWRKRRPELAGDASGRPCDG